MPGSELRRSPPPERPFEAIAADELAVTRLEQAVARVRAHIWSLPGGAPAVLAEEAEPVWGYLDATGDRPLQGCDGTADT